MLCDVARASYRNGKHVSFIYKTVIDATSVVRFVRMLSNELEIEMNLVLRRRRDVNLDITGNVVPSKRK